MNSSDVLILPLSQDEELVISSDNSGSIGEKITDSVQAPNAMASYYSCRVAYMDLLRTRAKPLAIILQNFTNDEAWLDYVEGIQRLLSETKIKDLPITGSTESNFSLKESAFGITMLGRRKKNQKKRRCPTVSDSFAVIGSPLVGKEVIKHAKQVAPLSLYESFVQEEGVIDLVAVGSKGILAEWQRLTKSNLSLETSLDIKKSGGPATCFLIAFEKEKKETIQTMAKDYYHPLYVQK